MHYAKTSHVTTTDHSDRPKNLDSTTLFLGNVAHTDNREEMDSGLDSPNEPDVQYEKNDSNADQRDQTTASSTPDDFSLENPAQSPQATTITKKKPRKRRWILSRKPKIHRSSTKIPKVVSEEKSAKIQEPKHIGNGSKYLPVINLEPMIHSSVFCPPNNNSNNDTNNNGNLEIFNNEPNSFDERNIIFSDKFLEFSCKFLPNLNRMDENNKPQLTTADRSMKNWSIEQVADFIRKLKLSSATRATTAAKSPSSSRMTTKQPFQWLQPTADDHLAEKFRDEQIDGEALLLLSREDLVRRLNIKLGLAIKIYYTIKCLNYKLCSIPN
uniref:SAM domain-containing protein n=1 Tax=Romanomermis culicivorax TaxID=13658 RepID=A0A915ISN6_ROMCU